MRTIFATVAAAAIMGCFALAPAQATSISAPTRSELTPATAQAQPVWYRHHHHRYYRPYYGYGYGGYPSYYNYGYSPGITLYFGGGHRRHGW